MTAKQTLKAIKKMGELIEELCSFKEKLRNEDFFCDIEWCVLGIYRNCKIEDGVLYDSEGNDLSNDGNCMDEDIPYFVNQYTGYICDDYHGTMYVKVDDENTFVSIHYDC